MFNIGQKIICIDDNFTPSTNVDNEMGIFNTYPKQDQTYTVRAYGKDSGSILLEEIKNFPALYSTGFGERSFRSDRFVSIEDFELGNELMNEINQQLKITA